MVMLTQRVRAQEPKDPPGGGGVHTLDCLEKVRKDLLGKGDSGVSPGILKNTDVEILTAG